MWRKICTLGIFFLLFSCQQNRVAEIEQNSLSFYYWRTIFCLDSTEKQYLKDFEVKNIYLRYMDVALQNDQPIVVAPIRFKDSLQNVSQGIIPVVYIKNEVVLKSNLDIDDLARKIVSFLQQVDTKNNIVSNQIQLDCDWSLQSKETFFKLVKRIKQISGKTISCTIRLHQIKYASKTGVPQVDYGVLMYYNMSSINSDTINSIYNRDIARSYLGALKHYPLKLQYALPIYSWVVISDNSKVVGLLNAVDLAQLQSHEDLRQIKSNVFVATEQTLVKSRVVQKGQELKLESINQSQLNEMVQDLKHYAQSPSLDIILYDLNTVNLTNYEKQTLQNLVDNK